VPGLHPVTSLSYWCHPPQTGLATSRVYPVGMALVVIADEDYGVLYLLAILIDRLGWTSDMAANGAEAWEMVSRQTPDVVIAEVDLPGMSGLDLLRAIKSSPSLAHTAVVLMGSQDDEAAASAAGCASFVTKPSGGRSSGYCPGWCPRSPPTKRVCEKSF
jgi:CheY-like chemotaxis protein